MVRVSDRDRQRIGSIGRVRSRLWQQKADHGLDLAFLGVSRAGDSLFDQIGRIFGNRQSGARRGEKCDASRLTKL